MDKFNQTNHVQEIKPPVVGTARCGGSTHPTEESRFLPLTTEYFFANRGERKGFSRLCKGCYNETVYGDRRVHRKQLVAPKFDSSTHKWCKRCNRVFLRSEFYNASNTKDGLNPNCKECKADQKRKQQSQRSALEICSNMRFIFNFGNFFVAI